MPEVVTLTCPKCQGDMRTYERNGVLVDQCEECRGIFLDRGELERLMDAEAANEPSEDRSDGREKEWDRHEHREGHRKRRTSATSLISDLLGGGD